MSETYQPRRSVLYMPSSNARALDKAKTLPVDALILDLEDAVGSEDKPAARVHAYRLFSTMMRTAVDDGLIAENPVRVRGAATYEVQREGRVLTPEEVASIAEHMPAHFRIGVPLAAYGALRIGEVLALRRRDLALDGYRQLVEPFHQDDASVLGRFFVRTIDLRREHFHQWHDLVERGPKSEVASTDARLR